MAATDHSVGIAHLTVIPTNAATVETERDDGEDSDATDAAGSGNEA